MQLDVHPTPEAAQEAAAGHLAAWIREAVEERGSCAVALSGGSTPGPTFRRLAAISLPWDRLDVFQVDERVAPADSKARNLDLLRSALVRPGALPAERLHAMPVEAEDLGEAAARYGELLEGRLGRPPGLDVVHLGLGADGHTASLFPGDPVVDVQDRPVALSASHSGHRRMTLTLPTLDAARRRLWLVCGEDKAEAVGRLHAGGTGIPAARVRRSGSRLVLDRAAARGLPGRAD